MILSDTSLLRSVLEPPMPTLRVSTGAELLAAMRGGARLIQAYVPRWSGDTPRDVLYLQRGEERVQVAWRVVGWAMRAGRIRPPRAGNCFGAREWTLSE